MHSSHLSFETIDSTARGVAFVARHAAVPIHLSCIRRLNSDRFNPTEARRVLLRAALLLERQRIAEIGTSTTSSSASSPVKLQQQSAATIKNDNSISSRNMTVLAFYSVFESVQFDQNSRNFSGGAVASHRISTRIAELTLKSLPQESSTPNAETIELFSVTPTPTEATSQQTKSHEDEKILQQTVVENLVGLWYTDRSIAQLDGEMGSFFASSTTSSGGGGGGGGSASTSAMMTPQNALLPSAAPTAGGGGNAGRLASVLLQCAWRLDLAQMFEQLGLCQKENQKTQQNSNCDKKKDAFLTSFPSDARSFDPPLGFDVFPLRGGKRSVFESKATAAGGGAASGASGDQSSLPCFSATDRFCVPRRRQRN